MMNKTFIGLLAGLLLALAALNGGVGGFFLALVFAIIGGLVGAQLDGTFAVSYTHLTLPTTPYV